jgi:hypothetical protein
VLRSLIKFNVIHIWPNRVVCYQGSWPRALEIKAEIVLSPDEGHAAIINKLSEYVSHLAPWHPIKMILFGDKLIYRLVGHQAQLSPAEFVTLVEHQLQKILGRKANDYLNFIQHIHYEQKNIGASIDAQWLHAIQSVATHAKLYLADIQPAASWLFNKLRKQLPTNSWCIVTATDELYFIKLNGRQIDHFKVTPLKDIANLSQIIRREVLMFGDDPEDAEIHIHNITDITKSRKITPSSAVMADKLT